MRVLSYALKGLLIAGILGLSAGSALAHKVIASGYAAGSVIEGEVGFSNGDSAKQATIIITDPDGAKLGEAQTDDDGFFTFTPHQAVPHIFTANLGSGHIAEFRMEVEDLPRALRLAAAGTAGESPATPSPPSTEDQAALGGVSAPALRELVAEAVREEIRPLRHELIATREKASLTSVLGGLGTILGLVGVAYYMMARRKLAEAATRNLK